MKKLPFLLSMIVVLSLVIPGTGQEFYIGATGGMNIAEMKITGDGEEQEETPLNRLGIGGVFGFRFDDNFSLQLRPLYLQKGGTLDQDSPSPDIDFRTSFIELDLSLKAATGNTIRPYILAGPSIGFLMTSELEFDLAGNKVKGDITDISKKTEYSLGIGAGVEYSFWNGFLFVEGRYLHGLNNLNKGGVVELKVNGLVAGTQEIANDDEYKNRGFQIMAGFALPLGQK